MVLPVTLELRYADGSSQRRELPIEMWNRGSGYVAIRTGGKAIAGVVLDPQRFTPTWIAEQPVAALATRPAPAHCPLASSRFWRGSSTVFAVLGRGLAERGHGTTHS